MSTNTINARSNGQVIDETFFNDLKSALSGDFVGRGATGVPQSGQANGTVAYPWGVVRTNALVVSGQTIDPSLAGIPQNVLISGAKRSGSNQSQFIDPSGAGLSLTVIGTATSLVYDVNGTEVTISADIVKSSLTAAPNTNNTALINDVDAADQNDTWLWGETSHRKTITIDTVGSEISALIGKYATFKLAGVGTEYFYAYVKSATELTQCMRGYFFDPSGNPIKRTGFSNNDTLTLMKTGYLFAENNGTTVDVSYANPSWSFDSPAGPVTGDYWYDLANLTWKRYDGAAWQIINRTYIGMFVNDTTDCVAARSADFYARYDDKLELNIELSSTEIARAVKPGGKVSVNGNDIYFGHAGRPSWNITTDLAGSADMQNASEQASTLYLLYVKDTGETVMSDVFPYERWDLCGWYHPWNPWRCVGMAYNNGASDLSGANGVFGITDSKISLCDQNGFGSSGTKIRRYTTTIEVKGSPVTYLDDATNGASFTCQFPCVVSAYCTDGDVGSPVDFGFSLNASSLSTSLAGLSNSEILIYGRAPTGQYCQTTGTVKLRVGDVLRMHTDGVSSASSNIGKLDIKVIGV